MDGLITANHQQRHKTAISTETLERKLRIIRYRTAKATQQMLITLMYSFVASHKVVNSLVMAAQFIQSLSVIVNQAKQAAFKSRLKTIKLNNNYRRHAKPSDTNPVKV